MKTLRAILIGSIAVFFMAGANHVCGMRYHTFNAGIDSWQGEFSWTTNNLSAPTHTTVRTHDNDADAGALAIPLSFTDQVDFGMNDIVYFDIGSASTSYMDFSTANGFAMYIYVDQGATYGNPGYPIQARIFVRTALPANWNNLDWYSGPSIEVVPGQWNKIYMNITSVPNINYTYEYGVQIFDGRYDSGSTTLYLDEFEIDLADLDLTAPANPTGGLTAVSAGTGNQINLSWSTVADADFDHFNIYRATFTPVPQTERYLVSRTAGNSYNDTSVVIGMSNYNYNVASVDRSQNVSSGITANNVSCTGPAPTIFSMKGMTYTVWEKDVMDSVASKSSLDDLRSTGANYVSLVVTQYVDNIDTDTTIESTSRTIDDDELVQAIADIHARGMSVMLKPHVDVEDDSWRGDIHPTNISDWFDSYETFIAQYANIAAANGVEMFCVGTELKKMTDDKSYQGAFSDGVKTARWNTIISQVNTILNAGAPVGSRSVPLVYAANAAHPQDEFSQIRFWDQLDYVGMDIYWKLTDKTDPTIDEIKQAWGSNYEGFNPLQIVTDFKNYTGKDIIFTEIGYSSTDGANTSPTMSGGTIDQAEQENLYEMAFDAWGHKSWVEGMFWWHWYPDPNYGGPASDYFVPQDKPALLELTSRYGGESVRNFYDFETGVQNWEEDATGDTADNFGTPDTAVQAGQKSIPALTGDTALRFSLDLDQKVSNEIQDQCMVLYSSGATNVGGFKNLENYEGLKTWVYIPDSGGYTIQPSSPVKAALYVKTGDDYAWYQSNDYRAVTPGQWRELSLDFASANYDGTTPDQTVPNTDHIREIGVTLTGARDSSGNTTFLIDNISTRGGASQLLGLTLGTTAYNFGLVGLDGEAVMDQAIIIENSGNTNVRYYISVTNSSPGNWTPSATTSPAIDVFALGARFNSTAPALADFNANHVVTGSDVVSTASQFAGDQAGYNVEPSGADPTAMTGLRYLWLKIATPLTGTSDISDQGLTVNIMAEIE